MVRIYTDGSFNAQRNVGGWAAIVINDGVEEVYSGNSEDSFSYANSNANPATAQRMEIVAVLEGLLTLTEPSHVEVISDSKYVVNTMDKGWLEKWIREGDLDKSHLDLWKVIYTLSKLHDIKFTWVKGHNGDYYNEKCDSLAQSETKSLITLNELIKTSSNNNVVVDPKPKSNHVDKPEVRNDSKLNMDMDNNFSEEVMPFEIHDEHKCDGSESKKKRFESRESFSNGERSCTNKKKKFFYAVAKGRKVGVYHSWGECNKNVNKYKGAIFKKFESKLEAEEFIRLNK